MDYSERVFKTIDSEMELLNHYVTMLNYSSKDDKYYPKRIMALEQIIESDLGIKKQLDKFEAK